MSGTYAFGAATIHWIVADRPSSPGPRPPSIPAGASGVATWCNVMNFWKAAPMAPSCISASHRAAGTALLSVLEPGHAEIFSSVFKYPRGGRRRRRGADSPPQRMAHAPRSDGYNMAAHPKGTSNAVRRRWRKQPPARRSDQPECRIMPRSPDSCVAANAEAVTGKKRRDHSCLCDAPKPAAHPRIMLNIPHLNKLPSRHRLRLSCR